jgi:hypothetical protein
MSSKKLPYEGATNQEHKKSCVQSFDGDHKNNSPWIYRKYFDLPGKN